MDYERYRPYADADQIKLLDAIKKAGSQVEAANMLGINPSNVSRRLDALKKKMTGRSTQTSGRVHCFIPDVQDTPDTPNDHLIWAGHYIAEEKPDVVVQIGDFADFESLSSYDKGKKASEGRRVLADFDSANKAMNDLMRPIKAERGYSPELHLTLGNHENRVNVACENNAELDGFLTLENLNYKDHGWKVYPFLDIAVIDGVHYSHFFANPMSGRPYGGANITTRLNTIGFSFSMGHQQCHMHGSKNLNNGKVLRGLVSGSFYLHDEDYRGIQGNTHFRGLTIKHEVMDGNYDIMEVSVDYLCRRYEGMPLHKFMQKKYPHIFDRSLFLQRQALKYQ